MDPSFKMRVQGGSSCEYLWEVDFHPPNEPTRFVRELVHATLKDAMGYVEGLTEKQVNSFVSEYFESRLCLLFLLFTPLFSYFLTLSPSDKETTEPAWTPSHS